MTTAKPGERGKRCADCGEKTPVLWRAWSRARKANAAKHTARPWVLIKQEDRCGVRFELRMGDAAKKPHDDGFGVEETIEWGYPLGPDDADDGEQYETACANAKLIAAAPELADALKALVNAPASGIAATRARAALRKAGRR